MQPGSGQGRVTAHSMLGTKALRNLFLKSLTNARALFQIRETPILFDLIPAALRHMPSNWVSA